MECSFLCTDLLTCILLRSFHCNLILVFRSSLHCKTWVLVFLHSFYCGRPILVFLFHHCHHSHPLLPTDQKKNNIRKRKTSKSSSTDRICDWRGIIASLFHTLHSVFLFLPSNFFFLLRSVYPLLLLFFFVLTSLYLHLLFLFL